MAKRKPKDDGKDALDALVKRPAPRGVVGVVNARSTARMMSVSQRLAFADDIRSRSVPTDLDSTYIIRRDRDDR